MWVDQTAAAQLQRLWSRTHREEFLRGLYGECLRIARIRLIGLAQKARRALDDNDLDELSEQAASRLICRFSRRPDYQVLSFWKVLGNECRHALFDGGHKERGKQVFLRSQQSLETANGAEWEPCEEAGDPKDFRRDILSDHPVGWMIDKDLRQARTYREAIQTIAGYVSRRWIYDHAVQLRYVYRVWKAGGRRCAAN